MNLAGEGLERQPELLLADHLPQLMIAGVPGRETGYAAEPLQKARMASGRAWDGARPRPCPATCLSKTIGASRMKKSVGLPGPFPAGAALGRTRWRSHRDPSCAA